MPQSMVSVRSHTPGSSKNVWGFYSAGAEDWSQMLKNMTEMTCQSSVANIESGKQFDLVARPCTADRRSSINTKSSAARPMTTPELRQRTIAIKMKSISYDHSVDSVHTSKELLVHSMSGHHISDIPNSPSSYLNKSNSFGRIRSRGNSVAAETLRSFLVAGESSNLYRSRQNSAQNDQPYKNRASDIRKSLSSDRPMRKGSGQHRSAKALTKVTLPGDSPQRNKST